MTLSLSACGKSDTDKGTPVTDSNARQESSSSEQSEFVPVSLGNFSAKDF